MAATNDSSLLSMPDEIVKMLAAEDKRKNFPAGTMQSLMQQEVGGNLSKYMKDPTTYHYGLNAKGKRIAGHTGKVSTAFGPFGLLESTAAKPGYGVTPLGDKSSLVEQARFAADYLAARSKKAGSLDGGLAGYGEGAKYASQVAGRIPSAQATPPRREFSHPLMQEPVLADAAPVNLSAVSAAPQAVASPDVAQVAAASSPGMPNADPWQEFLQRSREAGKPEKMAYGAGAPIAQQPNIQLNVPDFMGMAKYMDSSKSSNSLRGFESL